jgi:TolA-binding protein
MDAVTYPSVEVEQFMNEKMIGLRIPSDHPELSSQFNIKWTPTVITLDAQGVERHRTVGFLGPDEFIASQLLGAAKADFDLGRFDRALESLQTVIDKYRSSDYAPEAIYLRGVTLYKSTKNAMMLREAYDTLAGEFPKSEWAKRAYPYRLIQ